MIELEHAVLVNDPANSEGPVLTQDDVWEGLLMKANNALPFVPQMEKCDVVEERENFILRDIHIFGDDLREEVTLTPKSQVQFKRVEGRVLGVIKNDLYENADGELELKFSFKLEIQNPKPGEEQEHLDKMRDAYMGAVVATLGAIRKLAVQRTG